MSAQAQKFRIFEKKLSLGVCSPWKKPIKYHLLEFVFLSWRLGNTRNFRFQVFPSRQDRKINLCIRFLGEVTAQQFSFAIYWRIVIHWCNRADQILIYHHHILIWFLYCCCIMHKWKFLLFMSYDSVKEIRFFSWYHFYLWNKNFLGKFQILLRIKEVHRINSRFMAWITLYYIYRHVIGMP